MAASKITYDNNLIKVITLFETLTGATAKDCFEERGVMNFVISPENMGLAIGRNGANIRRIEHLLKKKTRIIEHSPDVETFIKNLIYPITAKQVQVADGTATITGSDTKSKGMLIGRNSSNLNSYRQIIKRHFDIKELRVV